MLRNEVFAHVAQLVEHTLGKGEVTGSTPVMGSKYRSCRLQGLVELRE